MAAVQILANSLRNPLTPDFQLSQDVLDFKAKFSACVNFTGHGANNQIHESELDRVNSLVDDIVLRINAEHKGKWFATYGGDPHNPEKPDIAVILHRVASHGVPIVAVQCDKYAGYMVTEDGSVADKSYDLLKTGAAVVYKTESENGNILYGGKDNKGNAVGATRYIYKLFGDKIIEHISFGGGKVALQEFIMAQGRSLKTTYHRVKARNPTSQEVFLACEMPQAEKEYADYGVVDAWYSQKQQIGHGYI
eukprot:m.339437 g.339437  ORF g.339437 m.339437 type:complete len:250 (+) comp18805_c0_seq1:17-766(+)